MLFEDIPMGVERILVLFLTLMMPIHNVMQVIIYCRCHQSLMGLFVHYFSHLL